MLPGRLPQQVVVYMHLDFDDKTLCLLASPCILGVLMQYRAGISRSRYNRSAVSVNSGLIDMSKCAVIGRKTVLKIASYGMWSLLMAK